VRTPPQALLQHRIAGSAIRAFAGRFNAVRWPADARLTSWWRTPEGNATAAGAEFSQHLLGLAADLVTSRPREAVALAQRAGLVALYHNAGSGWHVHVQSRPRGYVQQLVSAAPDLRPWVGLGPTPAPPRMPAAPRPAPVWV